MLLVVIMLFIYVFACASNIFLARVPLLEPLVPSNEGEHTSRGSLFIIGLNLFDSTKRGRSKYKLTKYLSKNQPLDLMSLGFVIIKKGEIVDINY
jgi:hypothetical protein